MKRHVDQLHALTRQERELLLMEHASSALDILSQSEVIPAMELTVYAEATSVLQTKSSLKTALAKTAQLEKRWSIDINVR